MTNLKKVIALALAATSVLSTVASAASFTDTVDSSNVAAIDMLTALGIIKGYDDGTFRPDATVTRAEMAKMIFTIKNAGSDDASDFADLYSELSDISGHWAEGYIKYCETNGIIAGYGDNTFKPDAEVTGVEALKMALVTLGYKADKAGLEGTYWSQNTMSYAMDVYLTKNVSSYTSSATRENAAQILYNALYAKTVVYSNDISDFTGASNGVDNDILAVSAMNLNELENRTVTRINGDIITIGGIKYTAFEDYTDFLNQEVTVLANEDDELFGLTRSKTTNAIVANFSDISFDDDDVTYTSELPTDGTKGEDEVDVYTEGAGLLVASYNGVEIDGFSESQLYNLIGGYSDKDAAKTSALYTDNDKLIIAQNDDDAPEIYAITFNVAEVTYTNTTKINTTNIAGTTGTSYTYEDNVIADDIEKGSFVTVSTNLFTEETTIETLTGEDGTIDAVQSSKYRINGIWYTASAGAGKSDLALGNEVTIYAVNDIIYGVDLIEEEASSTVEVVLVTAIASVSLGGDSEGTSVSSSTAYREAKVMDVNGTETIIKVASYEDEDKDSIADYGSTYELEAGGTSEADNFVVGALCTYEKFDSFYVLSYVTDGIDSDFEGATNSGSFVSDDDADKVKLGGKTISDDAVFFVATWNKTDSVIDAWSILTGAEVKAWDDSDLTAEYTFNAYTNAVDGFQVIQVGQIQLKDADLPNTTSDDIYGYITSNSYTTKVDGDTYEVYTIFNGTEEIEVMEKDGAVASSGSLITYKADDDSIIEVVSITASADVSAVAISAYNSKAIEFYNGTSYDLSDDLQIVYIDTNDKAGIEGGSVILASEAETDGNYIANASVVVSNGEVIGLYVDVSNEFLVDGATVTTSDLR